MIPRLRAKGVKNFFKSWPFGMVLFIWKTLACCCWVFIGELSRSLCIVQRFQTLQLSWWKSPEWWSSDALAFPIPRDVCIHGIQTNYSICGYLVWNWNSYREKLTLIFKVSYPCQVLRILESNGIVFKY